jgi:hypothetical protein
MLSVTLLPLAALAVHALAKPGSDSNVTTWRVVWVGGQSNSVGTNSDTTTHPTWPLNSRIQQFVWRGELAGTFATASYPIFNEGNVSSCAPKQPRLQKTQP